MYSFFHLGGGWWRSSGALVERSGGELVCGLWGGMGRWGSLVSLKKKRGQSEELRLASCTHHRMYLCSTCGTAAILEGRAAVLSPW